ncbi:MAG: glycyl-radical enzyme activating protein [Coprobacillus sp.]
MDKGIVFNIQKFSIHDGPGIRTTVFFKGCPLKCQWCSNPESQLNHIQILYDYDKCSHCLSCVHTCPHQAIKHINNRIIIDSDKCTGCLQCIRTCPMHALKNEGDYKTVEEIVKVCLQDKDFYEESQGGVTISGGEGMSQPQFLKTLVSELKKENIHLAIETTGYISQDIFQDLAKQFDLLLFDVKHYDSQKHYLGTNVHNKLIIENLKWAINNQIDVLPRIPVIPDFNDSLEDSLGLATLLKEVGASRVQLLPFHQFGEKKYDMLNKEYLLKNKKALYPEDLKDYQQIFIDKGLDCFF